MNGIVNQISRLIDIRTDIIEALKENNDPDVLATIDGDIDNAKYADLVPAVQELKSDGGALASYAQRNTTLMNPEVLEGITAIRPSGFRDWPSLDFTSLPSGITSIGNSAFYGCSNLALTSLPSGITSIGNYAFYGCNNLALTSLPSGITSIGTYAFYNCPNLALTSLPSGITSIGDYTFRSCSSLALTSLPSGVTNIDTYAFRGCTSLTTLTFLGTPSGTISSTAFSGCTNLLTINVPWASGAKANAPWGATNATINYNYTP